VRVTRGARPDREGRDGGPAPGGARDDLRCQADGLRRVRAPRRALSASPADRDELVEQEVEFPGGALRLLQPWGAGDLTDDGRIGWAPMAPYWSVLWRSGQALARGVAQLGLAGRRVVELGCGLGLPRIAAARAGARVLATDQHVEALELLARNAAANGVAVETAVVDWSAADELVARGPFDRVLAADVLYERQSVATLAALLPRLAPEAWIADPGRE